MNGDTNFEFVIPGSDYAFRVEGFQVQEHVFQPFQMSLTLLCTDADVDLDSLLRESGVLSVFGQGTGVSRIFNGVVNEVRFLGSGRQFSRYQINLVPHLWFMGQRQDCRIFQEQTVVDIVSEVLSDADVSDVRWDTTGEYEALEYVLQYRESDLDFIHRMLSQFGIWYYFEHTDAGHTLVFIDNNDTVNEIDSTDENSSTESPVLRYYAPGGGVPDREHIFAIDSGRKVRTGKMTVSDYDYRRPNVPLEMESEGAEFTDLAVYDYPGRYIESGQGQALSGFKLAAQGVAHALSQGQGCVMRMVPGHSFEMEQHPRDMLNTHYLVLGMVHIGTNPQAAAEDAGSQPTTYSNSFSVIELETEYRAPQLPAPVLDGPQTAIVVGPAGEEIFTDEMGRIKVQFHWDRYGALDENSTCWIRVSQTMAAPGWGAVYLPRIGHEVVVTFLEGDPDQPLVTGAVFNGAHPPPYALPDNKTRTTFRTQTHKGEGFNELSFEDEANQEEFYIRAQRDMGVDVFNDQFTDVRNDQFLKVGRHQKNEIMENHNETIHGTKTTEVHQTFDETVHEDVTVTYNANETVAIAQDAKLEVGQDRTVYVGANEDIAIDANQAVKVANNRSVSVGDNDACEVGGAYRLDVTGAVSIQSDASTQIISADSIVLKTGGAQISMSSSGAIQITGSAITIDGSDKVIVTGGKVAVN